MAQNAPTTVRFATTSDAESLHRLRLQLFRESSTMLLEADEYTATIDEERSRIGLLMQSANSTYLVAEAEGRLVGLAFAIGSSARRLRHSTTVVVGVETESEGRGIGTRLVRGLLEWSREAGLKRVELTVHVSHQRAVHLYQRCGFVIEGVRRASLLVEGRYLDEYCMAVKNG